MPELRVSLHLPYALRLELGEYQTSQGGESLTIDEPPLEETLPRTTVSATFTHGDEVEPGAQQQLRVQDADRLLRRTNRMLRWYRSVRGRGDIVELTRAQASPIHFELLGEASLEGWDDPLKFEEIGPLPSATSVGQITIEVREGLMSGNDPPVEVLFLIDAERGLQQGRFREAVLFCWSTIDSVFNRKYDAWVDVALADEWSEARKFFKGLDFGLRAKMSAGLRFVANQSLFSQPGNLWERMSQSYQKRNHIIHRGENATEDEARQSIAVAQAIVNVMNALPEPAPQDSGDLASDGDGP